MSKSSDDHWLEQLIQKSPSGILVVDEEGLLKWINATAERMITLVGDPLGRKPQEAIPIPELWSYCDIERQGQLEGEIAYGHRDFFVRSVFVEPKGRLVLLEDISSVKRVERSQREFVANVSHELRTPATSISGYAEMLLADKAQLSEDHVMMVEAIHRNGIRLNALFEDLLVLSKIEADNSPLSEQPLVLAGIVQECVDKQMARAEQNFIQFNIIVSERLMVLANRDALIHIVGNLIENAVKYSNPHGLVTVRASLREAAIQLEVIDLGIGIAPSHQERIFERFFRVDKGRSRHIGGTGLGLAIVQKLLDRTGIQMELRSQVDKGSIFRMYLKPHFHEDNG